MRCVFYVLDEDDSIFELSLPFCPARGLWIRFRGENWTVETVELHVEPNHSLLEPDARVMVWLTPAKVSV